VPPAELLCVEDLRVEYLSPAGDVCVVDRVSLKIGAGEIFGLAGESGSGKSTLAQAILRLLKPPAVITGGHIFVQGQDVLSMDDEALRRLRWRQVALVTQSAMSALSPVLTIGEQLSDVLEVHEGLTAREAEVRVSSLLNLVGIDPARRKSYPHELSGGMRQRVVIAMALALRAPLLIMDEPTTALDVVVQKEIMQQIAALRDELGFAVLLITHDLSLMLELCSRIGVLYAGRLCETAPARDLLTTARHPYTRGLLSSFPDVRRSTRLLGIPGAPADLARPPTGCRFHPRCAQRIEICGRIEPPLLELAQGHSSACHVGRHDDA
jgi:peptide/nickel transport system ATP-binding protein